MIMRYNETTVTRFAVASIRRAPSSSMGNPAYVLTAVDGTEYRTSANISSAYAMGPHWLGRHVDVTLTRAGRIRTAWLVGSHIGGMARHSDGAACEQAMTTRDCDRGHRYV